MTEGSERKSHRRYDEKSSRSGDRSERKDSERGSRDWEETPNRISREEITTPKLGIKGKCFCYESGLSIDD